MRTRRRTAVAAVLIITAVLVLPGASLLPSRAGAAPEPEFTKTQTVTRNHLNNGADEVVDTKNVTVTVSQTKDLRPRQLIDVRWTGARPTQGYALNPNDFSAALQEYPVVIMQCWGGVPVDPRNCWTGTVWERGDDRSYPGTPDFPPWRLDRYAAQNERKALVDYAPDPRPANCPEPDNKIARYMPFKASPSAGGQTYYINQQNYFSGACSGGLAPEMVIVPDDLAPPPNTTYAKTGADGSGGVKFPVWAVEDNASLGCSPSVACSLVVIPIMGISCDAMGTNAAPADRPTDAQRPAAESTCKLDGRQPVGRQNEGGLTDFNVEATVTGKYWWAASNWRNRIEVPLQFGTSNAACDSRTDLEPVDLLGSELMFRATLQWAPAFCTDPTRFRFRHVRVGEPQAKAAVATGSGVAALVSLPPPEGYAIPVVHAPVGVSGFAISFVADDKDGNPTTELKLTPRLIAKLLSESYPADDALKEVMKALPDSDPYKAMGNNPTTVVQDKEFLALNPNFAWNPTSRTGTTLLALSGNADVMWALTAYLNADPEARAWLNGTPDPWGMVVNPGYKNIALPSPTWPLLDTFISDNYSPYRGGSCDPTTWPDITKTPHVPLGPLLASPLAYMSMIVQQVPFAISNAHMLCEAQVDQSTNQFLGVNMKAVGRQTPGQRFMLGLTTVADARYYELDTAALQSTATVSDPTRQFTDATGRTFVTPSDDSMRAAMKLAKPDTATNTWPIVYNTLRGTDGADAYPGTLPIYLDVPTKDLPEGTGTKLSQLLKFAVTDGQKPGFGNGQLPPGYLPLNAENGLGDLVNYTMKAADAVAAQTGEVPPIIPVAASPSATSTSNSNNNGSSNNSNTSNTSNPTGVPNAGAQPSAAASASAKASPPAQARPVGLTALLSSALAAWALPIILLLGVCSAFTGAVTRGVAYLVTWWRSP